MGAATAYLARVVVEPCVEHLCADAAGVSGQVLLGPRPEIGLWMPGDATRAWEGIGGWEDDADLRWACLELHDDRDRLEMPVGHPVMDADFLMEVVATFLDGAGGWFCETRAGWGQQVDLQWPGGLTADGWRAAVERDREKMER